jgi:hypothetical protein
MTAHICPICSGEIMTYKRFLKAAEPARLAVCQCCGARLKRSRRAPLLAAALGLGLLALGGLLATRLGGSLTLMLPVAAGLALAVLALAGKASRWVIVDARAQPEIPGGRWSRGKLGLTPQPGATGAMLPPQDRERILSSGQAFPPGPARPGAIEMN